MQGRKIILPFLTGLFAASVSFCQSESLKGVVNNLALYKEKKDVKYLGSAKISVDSLMKASPDTLNVEKNVYRALVNATILYVDSLNKLKQSPALFGQTTQLVDNLAANRRIYLYPLEIDCAKQCLANVYIRKAFVYLKASDFINALQSFQGAKKYVPSFKQLDAYIAYSNNKLGNLQASAKYYAGLTDGAGIKAEYAETASNIYKSFGDTVSALNILKKARQALPKDKSLLLDEANIYNNKKDYSSLAILIPQLLDINTNNADIAFVAANCYDHLSEFNKAEQFYLRAVELNSAAYEPVFNLGLLYLKESSGKPENSDDRAKAVQWLEKANEISPNDVKCLKALEIVYAQAGNANQVSRIDNKLKQLTNQ